MTNPPYDVETLGGLLGARRSEDRIVSFIRRFDPASTTNDGKEPLTDDEYVGFRHLGFCLYFHDDILDAIFLYSAGREPEYATYGPALPMGLSFDQSKASVLDMLGQPDTTGGGHDDDLFGYICEWIVFDTVDGHSVHVEFAPDIQSIQMVTLMHSRRG